MSGSLLAHLYPRIKGSQEDIATYSLCYIVDQSEESNQEDRAKTESKPTVSRRSTDGRSQRDCNTGAIAAESRAEEHYLYRRSIRKSQSTHESAAQSSQYGH